MDKIDVLILLADTVRTPIIRARSHTWPQEGHSHKPDQADQATATAKGQATLALI